jgi:hypothetical protein
MDSNTHSRDGLAEGLAALAATLQGLATQDLDGLTDAVRAERVLGLRRLLDRLEGHWLAELVDVDASARLAPTRASGPPPPPAGSATGSTWGRPPPAVPCRPPGPCSAAP